MTNHYIPLKVDSHACTSVSPTVTITGFVLCNSILYYFDNKVLVICSVVLKLIAFSSCEGANEIGHSVLAVRN